jgi:hypothetical protein
VVDVSLDLLGKLLSVIYCCICARVKRLDKTGGVVTVRAIVIAKTYEWSSVDVTDTSASGDTVFDSNNSACFTNHPTLIVTLGYGELLNHWSDVGDIGYYGNSKGLCAPRLMSGAVSMLLIQVLVVTQYLFLTLLIQMLAF